MTARHDLSSLDIAARLDDGAGDCAPVRVLVDGRPVVRRVAVEGGEPQADGPRVLVDPAALVRGTVGGVVGDRRVLRLEGVVEVQATTLVRAVARDGRGAHGQGVAGVDATAEAPGVVAGNRGPLDVCGVVEVETTTATRQLGGVVAHDEVIRPGRAVRLVVGGTPIAVRRGVPRKGRVGHGQAAGLLAGDTAAVVVAGRTLRGVVIDRGAGDVETPVVVGGDATAEDLVGVVGGVPRDGRVGEGHRAFVVVGNPRAVGITAVPVDRVVADRAAGHGRVAVVDREPATADEVPVRRVARYRRVRHGVEPIVGVDPSTVRIVIGSAVGADRVVVDRRAVEDGGVVDLHSASVGGCSCRGRRVARDRPALHDHGAADEDAAAVDTIVVRRCRRGVVVVHRRVGQAALLVAVDAAAFRSAVEVVGRVVVDGRVLDPELAVVVDASAVARGVVRDRDLGQLEQVTRVVDQDAAALAWVAGG